MFMKDVLSDRHASLVPYTPGEQPRDRSYIKLNTNESPFPPPASVARAVQAECDKLQLYSDPDCRELTALLAERYGVKPEQVVVTNGSDEVLNFAFLAFADEKRPLCFPDLTYGFYPVFAGLYHIPYETVPLREDFTVDVESYLGIGKTIVLANPNAPTGMALPLSDIERIVKSNPETVVIVDEAYVDFGGQSAVPLIKDYDNLLVTMTFSKSRSLAGARLGFGIGNEKLIAALHTLRYATNPYNVNRMTAAAGCAALREEAYYRECCQKIAQTREWTAEQSHGLGFHVLPSKTNFLLAGSDKIGGEALYLALKRRGILVRHFDTERIRDFNRITIGTREQMQALLASIRDILESGQTKTDALA